MAGKKKNQQPKQQAKTPKVTVQVKQTPAKPKKTRGRKGNRQGGMAITSINEGVGLSVKPFKQKEQDLMGCDYLTAVTIAPSSAPTLGSAFIAQYAINPMTIIPQSRLSRFAALYDKYRIVSMTFYYATSVSTMTDGAIAMGWDADTDDDYSSVTGDPAIEYISNMPRNVQFSTYRNASLTIPGGKELFVQPEVGSDPRLVNHGRLWIASVGGLAAGTYGRIMVKWVIKFSRPNLDPDIANTPYACSIVAPSGTYISVTYPWGDFTNIIANTVNNISPGYNPKIVTFQSTIPGTSTAASVLLFNLPGQYRITISVTGTAIGSSLLAATGSSGCIVGGSGSTAAGYPYSPQGAAGTTNGGSTGVYGWLDVNCTQAGGYIYNNAGAGTHSTSVITVIRYPSQNLPPPASQAQLTEKLTGDEVIKLRGLMSSLALGNKAAPQITNTTTTTTTSFQSVPSPAGEPVRHSTAVANTTGEIGLIPVEVTNFPPAEKKNLDIDSYLNKIAEDYFDIPQLAQASVRRLKQEYSVDVLANMTVRGITRALEATTHDTWRPPAVPLESPWSSLPSSLS